MDWAYLIAFGGPVGVGLLSVLVVHLIRPRRVGCENRTDTLVLTKLADAERAMRLAADEIAELRQYLVPR